MLTSGVFGYIADYALWWFLFLSLVLHTWCFFQFFPRARFAKLGLVMGNVLVFLCFGGCAGLIGESYFRFLCVETDPFGWSVPARRWFVLYTDLNSLGCRDKEWTIQKPPGVRRIAFVGDSFTYGWGLKRVEDRFPDRIQSKFDQRAATDQNGVHGEESDYDSVEVLNVAKPGWDTGAELDPVRDMITVYAVDEVVLCYLPNDIEKLIPVTDDFNPIHPPQPRWFNPDSSCLMDYLYRRVWVPRAPTVWGYHDWLADGFRDEGVWRAHRDQLNRIVRVCRDADVQLRVVLLPYTQSGGDRFEPAGIHDAVRRFLETNDVEVVDLLPALAGIAPKDLMVNSHDNHPNGRAHELFAKAIWKAFYELRER